MLTVDNPTSLPETVNLECSTVYLALGANLGDRRANLHEALQRLRAGGRLHLTRLSRLYETEPVGYSAQPRFLNLVVEVTTNFAPLELLDYVKQIETELGRQPTFSNGPRPLDIDLLFYADLELNEARLQLPHPRMAGRGFVFAPLAELAPTLHHPVLGLTIEALLAEIDLAAQGVKLYTAEPTLELPPPRFLFVTGKLAGGWLAEYLTDLGQRLGFEYQIAELPIEVAAFMTVRFIATRLLLSQSEREKLDLMIVPGWARGDLAEIEQAAGGLKALRGPTDLLELEPFLHQLIETKRNSEETARLHHFSEVQLRAMQARLTDSNIRIYTDGQRIFAFNNTVFAVGEPDEKALRTIFRELKIENASHAFYIGKELTKAALSLKFNLPYHQDRELL